MLKYFILKKIVDYLSPTYIESMPITIKKNITCKYTNKKAI